MSNKFVPLSTKDTETSGIPAKRDAQTCYKTFKKCTII